MRARIKLALLVLSVLLLRAPTSAAKSQVEQVQPHPRVVHVFVALADNEHQGIVPVSPILGRGDDPTHNLYWGAAFGVRTFFRKSTDWKEIATLVRPSPIIAERLVFQHRATGTLLVADAYWGTQIAQAISDFLHAAAGFTRDQNLYDGRAGGVPLQISGAADLVVYVGHNGLMDFRFGQPIAPSSGAKPLAIILACASKQYFSPLLRAAGSQPLLWTTNLMAPEAYTLKAALDGWIVNEPAEEIRHRAAAAYARYQKCSEAAALKLFSSTW